MKAFPELWKKGNWESIQYVVGDKGYGCAEVRNLIRKSNLISVIPRRQNAVCPGVQDKERYATRSAIERFFSKIKENKRMALRFDKRDVAFFSFFCFSLH